MKLPKIAIALGHACTFQGTVFGDTISTDAITDHPTPRCKATPCTPTGLETEINLNESSNLNANRGIADEDVKPGDSDHTPQVKSDNKPVAVPTGG